MKLRSGSGNPSTSAAEDQGPVVQDRLREALRAATIGEFEVYDELGRGGMARVYLCYDISLDRHVAIKVMAPALLLEEGMDERFRREAKISASLSHPNIVPVYSVKQTDELAYFVMKYIDGCTLNYMINEHAPLPAEMVRQLLQQLAGALSYAHERGVVHRDIKPANILIDEAGRAILTDFGIARATGLSGLTATGASVGTPYYMSPEQCTRGEITGHSDQYALGIVGYQMLSGQLPFTGADSAEVLQAHLLESPAEISDVCRSCPPDLARVIMRMLAKRPADRWPTLSEAVGQLRPPKPGADHQISTQIVALARTGPVRPPLPKPPVSPAPNSRRNLVALPDGPAEEAPSRRWKSVALAAGFLVLLVVGTLVVKALGNPVQPDGNQATNPPTSVPPEAPSTPGLAGASTGSDSGVAGAVSPPNAGGPPQGLQSKSGGQGGSGAPSKKPERKPPDRVNAAAGKPADSVALAAAPAAPAPAPGEWAWVLLGTRYESAFLYINDEARLPQGPSLRLWRVRAGKVSFSLTQFGCIAWDTTVSISAGDTLKLYNKNPVCPP